MFKDCGREPYQSSGRLMLLTLTNRILTNLTRNVRVLEHASKVLVGWGGGLNHRLEAQAR